MSTERLSPGWLHRGGSSLLLSPPPPPHIESNYSSSSPAGASTLPPLPDEDSPPPRLGDGPEVDVFKSVICHLAKSPYSKLRQGFVRMCDHLIRQLPHALFDLYFSRAAASLACDSAKCVRVLWAMLMSPHIRSEGRLADCAPMIMAGRTLVSRRELVTKEITLALSSITSISDEELSRRQQTVKFACEEYILWERLVFPQGSELSGGEMAREVGETKTNREMERETVEDPNSSNGIDDSCDVRRANENGSVEMIGDERSLHLAGGEGGDGFEGLLTPRPLSGWSEVTPALGSCSHSLQTSDTPHTATPRVIEQQKVEISSEAEEARESGEAGAGRTTGESEEIGKADENTEERSGLGPGGTGETAERQESGDTAARGVRGEIVEREGERDRRSVWSSSPSPLTSSLCPPCDVVSPKTDVSPPTLDVYTSPSPHHNIVSHPNIDPALIDQTTHTGHSPLSLQTNNTLDDSGEEVGYNSSLWASDDYSCYSEAVNEQNWSGAEWNEGSPTLTSPSTSPPTLPSTPLTSPSTPPLSALSILPFASPSTPPTISPSTSPLASPPTSSPPLTSPPFASPPLASAPFASPPLTSPPLSSPPLTSPPFASPPLTSPHLTSSPLTSQPLTSPPLTSQPLTSPPLASPPVTSPPLASPPLASPLTSPPLTSPPLTSPPLTSPALTSPPLTSPPLTSPTLKSSSTELFNTSTISLTRSATPMVLESPPGVKMGEEPMVSGIGESLRARDDEGDSQSRAKVCSSDTKGNNNVIITSDEEGSNWASWELMEIA